MLQRVRAGKTSIWRERGGKPRGHTPLHLPEVGVLTPSCQHSPVSILCEIRYLIIAANLVINERMFSLVCLKSRSLYWQNLEPLEGDHSLRAAFEGSGHRQRPLGSVPSSPRKSVGCSVEHLSPCELT